MKELTEPPCSACNAHDQLEGEFSDMKITNSTDHAKITTSLSWVQIIGTSLAAMMASMFWMIWSIMHYHSIVEVQVTRNGTHLGFISQKIDENKLHQMEIKRDVYKKLGECDDNINKFIRNTP